MKKLNKAYLLALAGFVVSSCGGTKQEEQDTAKEIWEGLPKKYAK